MLLAWEDIVQASGTTITPSQEVSGFDADNIARMHLSEVWRATTLSGLSVVID